MTSTRRRRYAKGFPGSAGVPPAWPKPAGRPRSQDQPWRYFCPRVLAGRLAPLSSGAILPDAVLIQRKDVGDLQIQLGGHDLVRLWNQPVQLEPRLTPTQNREHCLRD